MDKRYYCPCCGKWSEKFIAGDWAERIDLYDVRRYSNTPNDVLCPVCYSMPRHRILAQWCEEHQNEFIGRRILDLSTENGINHWFASHGFRVTSSDRYRGMDPTEAEGSFPWSEASWDLLLCNHILERVSDYRGALSEWYHVLGPGGWLICSFVTDEQVDTVMESQSQFGDDSEEARSERIRTCGQFNQYRIFGRNARSILEDAGFEVSEIRGNDMPEEILPVVGPADYDDNVLYLCRKPGEFKWVDFPERNHDQEHESKWKQSLFVIRELTSREIKRKYVRSYLGMLWSVLHPLLYMLVMTLIFSSMFSRSITNFPLYYLTGYLIWELFNQTTNQVMTVLADNRELLLTVKVPKRVFALSRCGTAIVNFLLSLIPYALLLLLFRTPITWTLLLMPAGVFFCVLFSLGLGYLLAILYVFFADIQHLYSVLLTLWMYLSAIFYPIDGLPAFMRLIIYNNPVYDYIAFLREVMLYGTMPEVGLWIRIIGWGIGMYGIGRWVFHRRENDVMLLL